MKKRFTRIMAALALLVFMMPSMVAWGQTREEVVYKQTIFNSTNNSQGVSSYSNSWYNTTDGFRVDIKNANNNNNAWNYIKIGSKNAAYVGSLTTNAAIDNAITKVTMTIDAITSNNVNSMKLYTSSSGSNWTEAGSFSLSTGAQTVSLSTPTTNLYYRIEVDCKKSSNGVVTISKVEYYHSTGGNLTVVTPTFTPDGGPFYGSREVSISCATEGASIHYTTNGSDPTSSSPTYTAPFTIDATTTVKAIGVKEGMDDSSIASAEYTKVSPMSVADAIAAIDGASNLPIENQCVTGIVCTASTNIYSGKLSYWISDDGTTTTRLEAYNGLGLDGANFESVDDVQVGDVVVIYGNLTKYNSTYEFAANNYLLSLVRPTSAVEAPTFSPAAGTYENSQEVTITCATEGATIYYTTDGTDPTSASTEYTAAINVTTTTTIKAIAYLDEESSTVATATYTIVSLNNISDITEVGTAYMVQGTVVATNSRGFIMGDGTGYVYYYRNDAVSQSIGDKVKVSGTTSTYGQIIQFNNTATVTEVTTSNYNNTPAATLITEVPNYTQGYHLSTYFEFEGELTKSGSNYFIALGESQIQISYPTTEQGTALTALDGKNVHVKGYFSGINSNSKFTVMLESATEVLVPSITLNSYLIEATAEETEGSLTVTYTEIATSLGASIYWFESDGVTAASEPDWMSAEINTDLNVEYLIEENEGEARTAYFKVYGVDANLNDVYSDLVTVTQEAAPPVAYYDYSINGVVGGDINEAVVGTPVTLANGEDLNANFTFAGWSTDPDDVETLYTQYTFNADEVVTFYAVYAHTTGGATAKEGEASYVKVTSTDDIEDGNYLIVAVGTYADENPYQVAFNGSLNPFDAVGNVINVTINDDEIAATTETNAAAFTIASVTGGYSIQGTSGKYIGVSSYNNGLTTNDAAIVNGIDFENNNVLITVETTGGTMTLKFNKASNQNRFRYYKSGQEPIQLYKYTDGGTPTPQPTTAYYTRVFLADPTTPVDIVGPSIVPSGVTLNMGSNSLTNSKGASKFVIEDGAQLKTPSAVYATVEKNITGYGEANAQTNKGYYLVSAPAEKYLYVDLNNADVDAYRFDASQEQEEWQNFKLAQGAWHIAANSAVLYASKEDCTLSLDGYGIVYNHPNPGANIVYNKVPATTSNVNVDVVFNSGKVFEGFNLIGNPFTCTAYLADGRDFYRMNAAGDAIVLADDNNGGDAINVCEGIFVVCTANGTVTFTTTDPSDASAGNNNGMVNISVAQVVNSRGAQPSADYARIRINNGENLTKFVFNENTSRIYIPQAGKDYAVVRSAAEGEMPVSFKASKNGTYTLNIEAENVEMNYLHLIDNLTGMDVDLLQTPSYTFDAKTSDYASRFRLVFKANGTNENNAETFAYFNGTNWTVSNVGDATLQVVDVTGRTVANQMINGNAELNLNQPAGVYVIRLVNGDNVKTQKVVVR